MVFDAPLQETRFPFPVPHFICSTVHPPWGISQKCLKPVDKECPAKPCVHISTRSSSSSQDKAGFVPGMKTPAPTAPNMASSAPPAGSSQLRRDIPALDHIHSPSSCSCWRTQIHRCSGTGQGQKHSRRASLSVGNHFCLEPKANSASWPTFSSKVSRVQNKWEGVGNNLSE